MNRKWYKLGAVLALIGIVPTLLFVLIFHLVVNEATSWWDKHQKEKDEKQRMELVTQTRAIESRREVERKPTERMWRYVLEKPHGSLGLNPEDRTIERRAMLIEDSKESFVFRVFYNNSNDTENCEFFLDKNGSGLGVWTRRNPSGSGHWETNKIQTVKGGYCLSVNRDDEPDKWANAYLFPQN